MRKYFFIELEDGERIPLDEKRVSDILKQLDKNPRFLEIGDEMFSKEIIKRVGRDFRLEELEKEF